MATGYHMNLFIQVPDEGETEGWQVEQDAARCGRGTPLAGRQPHGGAGGRSMIAATSAGIVGAALCWLLAFATSASADCAWVLWLNHTGVLAGEELDIWTPLNASTNKPDCQQVLAHTLKANSTAGNPGDAVTLRGSNMIDITSAAGPHTLLYVCLPDTVDPRGPTR